MGVIYGLFCKYVLILYEYYAQPVADFCLYSVSLLHEIWSFYFPSRTYIIVVCSCGRFAKVLHLFRELRVWAYVRQDHQSTTTTTQPSNTTTTPPSGFGLTMYQKRDKEVVGVELRSPFASDSQGWTTDSFWHGALALSMSEIIQTNLVGCFFLSSSFDLFYE